ncbi:uncharacterized protein DEA37_0000722 [Paragonimus westermani]|uniref:Rho-GAP domain-containing protein n=1 Tax=Paragonimus westermani TaxID=34504 RepID=A0A5J4NK92_9TREM|nr:uncharacterized protein DEA37_0000722 [Paragonimus westermani]
MTDSTRASTEHDNTVSIHSNPSSCPIPRAPQSTSGILCETNKSNRKVSGGDGGTSVDGKQSEKLSSKKAKASFRLPGTRKRRKEQQQQKQQQVSKPTKSLTTEPLAQSNLQQIIVNDAALQSSAKHSKSEKRSKKERGGLGLLGREARDSRRKSKRDGRFAKASKAGYPQNTQDPVKPVFGVALNIAFERSPSHDGIPLPAFLRHCIDYIEMYGLCSESIYRVPGVHSQVQALVSALDRGEEFLKIPPTSAAFYQQHSSELYTPRATHRSLALSTNEGGLRSKQSHTGHSDPRSSCVPTPRLRSHADTRLLTTGSTDSHHLPHDLAVVASVVKQFLRNLPEPVLTNALRPVLESLPMESPQIYYSIARLVHQKLPLTHQFLLAWMLQHITHIIDRSDENLMPLANISIVLSPCLGISHRLLAVLLRPAPPDVHIDLTELNSSVKTVDAAESRQADSTPYHWLFPHPAFVLKPYRPPLRPGPDTQRLVTEIRRRKTLCDPEVIRAELSRQQALLDRLHKAIAADQSYPEPDALDGLGFPASGGSPSQSVDYVGRRRAHVSDKSSKQITEPISTSVVPDELWEVQRQVTMLKRRLKQQERLMLTSTQVTTSTITTVSATTATSSSHIVLSGSIPLVIPSVAELDQEEVLNLTLRKLPADVPPICDPVDSVCPVQMPLPDSKLESPPSASLHMTDLDVHQINPPESIIRVHWNTTADQLETPLTDPSANVVAFALPVPLESKKAVEPASTSPQQAPDKPPKHDDFRNMASRFAQSSLGNNDAHRFLLAVIRWDGATKLNEIQRTSFLRIVVTHFAIANVYCGPRCPWYILVQHDVASASALSEQLYPEVCPDEKPSDYSVGSDTKKTGTELVPAESAVAASLHSVLPPPSPPSPWGIQEPSSTVLLSANPAERQVMHQMALYTARKHELEAIYADLRARIWSENAEIRRIQSCIDHLLDTGGKRVQRIYDAEFAAIQYSPLAIHSQLTGYHPVRIQQSWAQIAEQLNTENEEYTLSKNEASCLIDVPDGSDSSGTRDEESEHNSDSAEDKEELVTPDDSDDSQPMAYSRLNNEEDEPDKEEVNGSGEMYHEPSSKSASPTSLSAYLVNTRLCEEEEEEDEEDAKACEAELARTLHQLTLDNARLERLNGRYLEGIQAERNRCAELKVLVKLRGAGSYTQGLPICNNRSWSAIPRPC